MTTTLTHKIILNGKPREIAADLTVAQLLAQLELPTNAVAVEVNARLVPRPEHAARALRTDDRVEVVSLVGGG